MGEPDLEEIGLPSECPYCNEDDFVFAFKSDDVFNSQDEKIGICEGFNCQACGKGFIFFTKRREFLAPAQDESEVEYISSNSNYNWALLGTDEISSDEDDSFV